MLLFIYHRVFDTVKQSTKLDFVIEIVITYNYYFIGSRVIKFFIYFSILFIYTLFKIFFIVHNKHKTRKEVYFKICFCFIQCIGVCRCDRTDDRKEKKVIYFFRQVQIWIDMMLISPKKSLSTLLRWYQCFSNIQNKFFKLLCY